MTKELPQVPSDFIRAMQKYLSIKVDLQNYDPNTAADKFDAFFICRNMYVDDTTKLTSFEMNLFEISIGGTAGSARFLSEFTPEQLTQMYSTIEIRNNERNQANLNT